MRIWDPEVESGTVLLDSLREGDEGALAMAYDRFAGRVYGLALRILGDTTKAEEVTQDVFLAAWRHRERFDSARGSLNSWLLTTARNRSVDMLRRERGRVAREVEVDPQLAASVDVEATVVTHLDRRAINHAVALLPRPQRVAIEGAYFDGRSAREIASVAGVPLGTVKSRMRLGLQRLALNTDLRTATAG